MTELLETPELEATQVEEDATTEPSDEVVLTPARPRLPAYVSNS